MARRAASSVGGPTQRQPRKPSQRQLRVGEALRHVLAELLMRDGLHEPGLAGGAITVSEVRISPDLRHAEVFVTELGGELAAERLEGLRRAAPALRGEAGRRLRLKHAPELLFRADRSFAEAARIEVLLARERAALPADREDDHGGV